MASLRNKAVSGIFWTFSQLFSIQAIIFVVSTILARVLSPSEFGIIGMITVFNAVGISLMDSGMTSSLIRTPNPTHRDFSTVFFFNIAVSVFIYAIIFFSAPFIAEFYNQPILKDIVRVYCLSFVLNASFATQKARLTKDMKFKTQMTITVPSVIVSSILGIFLAYSGFGVWSLVFMQLSQILLNSVQYWIRSKWVPSLVWDKQLLKTHFNFGYKLTLSGLLNTIFSNIYQIIIGKMFSPMLVGYYTHSSRMKKIPIQNLSNALDRVTYPLFASVQDDNVRLKKMYKELMCMVFFVVAPLMLTLMALAEPIFRFLFTEKWLPAVPFFQIMCITGVLYPIHSYNLNILKVKGRSDLFFKLEVYKKIVTVVLLLITVRHGIAAMLWGQVASSVIALIINSYYSGKFLSYPLGEQLKNVAPILIVAAFSAGVTYAMNLLLKSYQAADILTIIACCILCVLMYLGISVLLKFPYLAQIKSLILNRKNRKKKK